MTDQYYRDRAEKLPAIRALGQDPYGGRFEGVEANQRLRDRAEGLGLEAGATDSSSTARAAGRIVLLRQMGKLAFLTIRDSSGDLQIGVSKRGVAEADWDLVGHLDLGDWAGFDV